MNLSNKLGFALLLALAAAQAQLPAITAVPPGQIGPPVGVTLTVQAGGSVAINVPASTQVRNEVPAAGSAPQTWTLLRAPTAAGATCWRNGMHQSPGLDYMLAGNIITSATWAVGDVLACDYQ